MPRRDWRLRVTDILAAAERIGRYTAGLREEGFARDEKTVEAVCFALVVIGEAAAHVPERSADRPHMEAPLPRYTFTCTLIQ